MYFHIFARCSHLPEASRGGQRPKKASGLLLASARPILQDALCGIPKHSQDRLRGHLCIDAEIFGDGLVLLILRLLQAPAELRLEGRHLRRVDQVARSLEHAVVQAAPPLRALLLVGLDRLAVLAPVPTPARPSTAHYVDLGHGHDHDQDGEDDKDDEDNEGCRCRRRQGRTRMAKTNGDQR